MASPLTSVLFGARISAKTVRIVDLAGAGLEAFPPSLANCTNMQELDLARNSIHTLPDVSRLEKLQRLNLSGNKLAELPPAIGALTALTSLDLGSNALT